MPHPLRFLQRVRFFSWIPLFAYVLMDRLTSITYPDSSSTQFAYDYRGRRRACDERSRTHDRPERQDDQLRV